MVDMGLKELEEKTVTVKETIPVGSVIKVTINTHAGDYDTTHYVPHIEIVRPPEVH
jgi:hypothetical protein